MRPGIEGAIRRPPPSTEAAPSRAKTAVLNLPHYRIGTPPSVPRAYTAEGTYSNPTAAIAIDRISRQERVPREKITPSTPGTVYESPASRITTLNYQLAELKRRRKNGELSRKQYMEEKVPLVAEYSTLQQLHITMNVL